MAFILTKILTKQIFLNNKMAEKQKTINKSITLQGTGLHTGQNVTLTYNPAPENHGYKFQRIDMDGKPIIDALVENVIETERSTTIDKNGARVTTIEHVLSAAYGLGIDNLLIEINGPEAPILDGSAQLYVKALLEAGIKEQNKDKKFFVVKNNINFSDPENGIEIMTFPDDDFSLNVMIDYKSSVLGNQYASLNKLIDYKDEIAPCKTFVFLRELEYLYDNNLIKGGSLDNALVIIEKGLPQDELDRLADKFNTPRVKGVEQGILNEQNLIFNNEPARHKLLDLMGDLALVGMPIKGKILATRPGHTSNVQFAKKIRQEIKRKKSKGYIPEINLSDKPVLDINRIKEILPHRPPFLLVDKIMQISETDIVGVKNVTLNEPFFIGHFPEEPVMPGVLIVEAMAQIGGILVLNSVEDPEKYSTYLLKIENIKYKQKVVPGDTLVIKCEFNAPIRRGIVSMNTQAYVGETIVTEGNMTALVVKNK